MSANDIHDCSGFNDDICGRVSKAVSSVEVASNSKSWLYSGPYLEAFLFSAITTLNACLILRCTTFSLFYQWCLIPSRMMLFSPGTFHYGWFLCFPLLVVDWCSLMQVSNGLLVWTMYSFPQLHRKRCTPHQPCSEEQCSSKVKPSEKSS